MGKDILLTDGVGQNVTLFGRSFHVQTEICDGTLRTETFLGGRLVASREARLDDAERQSGAEGQRLRMTEHHKKIVSGMRDRAQHHRQIRRPAPRGKTSGRGLRDALGPRRLDAAPAADESSDVGLRVWSLIREFRDCVAASAGGNARESLEEVSAALAHVLASPLFKEIRIDEQIRFHLLQDQINAWQIGGRDPYRAAELRNDLEEFGAYLEGIDDRAEFAAVLSQASSVKNQEGEVRAFLSPQPGPPQKSKADSQLEKDMAKVSLESLGEIDGFVGGCLVDSDSGMMLGAQGGGVNLELAAAGNTQVVRAKRKTMETLRLDDQIEDILISLGKQYHLIRPLESNDRIFLYVVLDRAKSNLAMARHELKSFESSLQMG